MKINGNAVKPGMIIDHLNALWVVAKTQHVKPGKGGAFNQVEMKNLKSNSKLNERFRASEQVESCLLYTSPSPRDMRRSRMPSSA